MAFKYNPLSGQIEDQQQGPQGPAGTMTSSAGGTASTPGFNFSGDTDTGLYSAGINSVGIATGGTQRVVVDNNGNVEFSGQLNARGAADVRLTLGSTGDAAPTNNSVHVRADGADLKFMAANGGGTYFEHDGLATVTISNPGKVGIGTTSPKANLHIKSGSNHWSQGLLLEDSTGNDGWNFYPDPDSGGELFIGYNDDLSGSPDSASTVFKLKASDKSAYFYGNVGIGADSPNRLLHIAGSGTENLIRVGRTDSSSHGSHDVQVQFAENHYHNLKVGAETYSLSTRSTANALVINDSGKVGIGTTSPSSKLHILSSDARGHRNLLELKHTNTHTTGDGPALLLNGYYNSTEWAFAKIAAENSGSGYGSNLKFYVHPSDGNQTSSVVEALTITGDGSSGADVTFTGNVGIGTTLSTTPSSVLSVEPLNTSSGRNISLYTKGSTGNKAGIFFNATQGTGNLAEIQAEYTGTNQGKLSFNTSMSPRMLIDASGKVGIGTTTPEANLHVVGQGFFTSTASDPGDNGRLVVEGNKGYADSATTLATSTTKSVLRVKGSNNSSDSLWIGTLTTGGYHHDPYLQGANDGGTNTKNLSIQPYGGSVGIGQTSFATTDTKLSVSNTAAHCEVGLIAKNDSGALINFGDPDSYNRGRIKYNNNGDELSFRTAGSDRLTIDSSGFVGIGTNNPRRHFHIHNPASATVGMMLTNSDTGEANDGQGFQFKVASDKHAEISQQENSYIQILTNGSNAMRITNDQKVGIGTTSPSTKLEIADNNSSGFHTTIRNLNSTNGNYGELRFQGTNSSNNPYTTSRIVATNADNYNQYGNLAFYTHQLGSTTEKLKLEWDKASFTTDVNLASDKYLKFNGSAFTIRENAGNNYINSQTGSLYLQEGGNSVVELNSSGTVNISNNLAGINGLKVTGWYNSNGQVDIQTWERQGGAVTSKLQYRDVSTDMYFGTTTSHSLNLMTNGISAVNFNSTGNATFAGNIKLGANAENNKLLSVKESTSGTNIVHFINASDAGYGPYMAGGGDANYALKVCNYAGTEAFKVLGNGTTSVAGNIKMAADKGVQFHNYGAEESPDDTKTDVTGNTLSDYEEGTWVPAVNLTYNPGVRTPSTSGATGRYVKIGNQVTCWFSFGYTVAGSGSFNMGVDGLPFTAGNFSHNGGGSVREDGTTGHMYFCERILNDTTTIQVLRRYDNQQMTDNSGNVAGCVTYTTFDT